MFWTTPKHCLNNTLLPHYPTLGGANSSCAFLCLFVAKIPREKEEDKKFRQWFPCQGFDFVPQRRKGRRSAPGGFCLCAFAGENLLLLTPVGAL